MGESRRQQRWVFQILDFKNSKWVYLGDNSNLQPWEWQSLSFSLFNDISRFISTGGVVVIKYHSNNATDVSNLDYLVVEVETNNTWWQPSPSEQITWQWQLSEPLDQSFDVTMYDVDLFDTSKQQIEQLRAAGRIVICYFSAGTYEGWRSDWPIFFEFITSDQYTGNNPPFAGNMAEWDERWLDIRRIDLLAPIIKSRLNLAVEKGCDGVEPDNVDAYSNQNEVNLTPPLTAKDQRIYNRWLARLAHNRGLSVGLKNDIDQLSQLVNDFDWALNEQCFEYDECERYSVFTAAGKAVFGVEYQGDIQSICNQAAAMDLFWLKKNVDLTAWRQGCEDY